MADEKTDWPLIARVLWNRLRSVVGMGASYCPRWVAGQYVTYVAGPHSEAPAYTYYRLMLLRRGLRGWHLLCECKFGSRQIASFFLARAPYRRWRGAPPAVPQGTDYDFGEGQDDDKLLVVSQWAWVANLLETMNHPDLLQSARLPSEVVESPALGRFTTHTVFDSPGGTCRVSRRVPITGILSATTEADVASLQLTSFGCNNTATSWQGAGESYVDWCHLMEFDHGSFSLNYPGTWFFHDRSDELAEPDKWSQSYVSVNGGNTCAVALGVLLYEGDPASVKARCVAAKEATASGSEGFVPRQAQAEPPGGDIAIADLHDQAVAGVCLVKTQIAPDGTRLALLHARLMVAHSQPGQRETMATGEAVLQQVLASFRFSEAA